MLSLIRENLNDRYKSGFPVMQELVQNADDAPARRLEIGWTVGLPNARQPLLKGPAIFVANDDVSSRSAARAIDNHRAKSKQRERIDPSVNSD